MAPADPTRIQPDPTAMDHFEPANHHTSAHPNSVFVNGPFIEVTETGRLLLFGDELKVIDGANSHDRKLGAEEFA